MQPNIDKNLPYLEELLRPFLQKQIDRIDALEQLVSEQQKIIEQLHQDVEALKPSQSRPKTSNQQTKPAIPPQKPPSSTMVLPKPQDLPAPDEKISNPNPQPKAKAQPVEIKTNPVRRNTITKMPEPEPKPILQQRRQTQIITQQDVAAAKEGSTPKPSIAKADTKKAVKPEVRKMVSSKSSKDLHVRSRDEKSTPDIPKVIDKSAIKAKKQALQFEQDTTTQSLQTTPIQSTSHFDQIDPVIAAPKTLLEQLDIGKVTSYEGDVDLLADDPQLRKVEQFFSQQQQESVDHNLPAQLVELVQLCRGDFKAELVINELQDHRFQSGHKALINEIVLIRDQYEREIEVIKPQAEKVLHLISYVERHSSSRGMDE